MVIVDGGGGAIPELSLNAESIELVVAGGNHDMIPMLDENILVSDMDAEVKWGAGDGGIPVTDSSGVIQCCDDMEEMEGEGGTGGVSICFCEDTLLPGENGAGCTAIEAWSVSMTT